MMGLPIKNKWEEWGPARDPDTAEDPEIARGLIAALKKRFSRRLRKRHAYIPPTPETTNEIPKVEVEIETIYITEPSGCQDEQEAVEGKTDIEISDSTPV